MKLLRTLGLVLAIAGNPAAWASPPGDLDADLVLDLADDCPTAWNPLQADTGGVGAASSPDGVGDACQCGDINFDFRVTGVDVALYRLHLARSPGAELGPAALLRCDVVGVGAFCNIQDVAVLERALEPTPLAPGLASLCPGGATDAGVFVATSGSDANPGSADAPLQTLTAGLVLAQSSGSTQIWVGSGDYAGPTLALVSGISITGGFDPVSWEQPALFGTRYLATDPVAAQAASLTAPTKLEQIELWAANAAVPGQGSYALRASSSSSLTVVRSVLVAGGGNGGLSGANGSIGAQGGNGQTGEAGCENSILLCRSCSQPSGGSGGSSACGRTGGPGGLPGLGTNGGSSGGTGVGGTPGGPGAAGFGANGSTGPTGNHGELGVFGTAGSTSLVPNPFGLLTASGGAGSPGTHGNGGGGGGGGGGGDNACDSYGSSGGGGGAGGCAGGGGFGGGGGGASVALYLFGASAVVSETVLMTAGGAGGGMGGIGGLGGNWGLGGAGGPYGTAGGQDDAGDGANGARGGLGGSGGPGGGGAGGPSLGIACRSGASLLLDSENLFSLGTPGPGGLSPGNNGLAGLLADRNGC